MLNSALKFVFLVSIVVYSNKRPGVPTLRCVWCRSGAPSVWSGTTGWSPGTDADPAPATYNTTRVPLCTRHTMYTHVKNQYGEKQM